LKNKVKILLRHSHSKRSKGKGQLTTNFRTRSSYSWLCHLNINAYYKYRRFRSPIL